MMLLVLRVKMVIAGTTHPAKDIVMGVIGKTVPGQSRMSTTK